MKKPILELKKVKMFRGRDGVGLDCDLFVNGAKVARVFDDASGGENDYQPYGKTPEESKANRKIIEELEVYAKTLPAREGFSQNLSDMINDLIIVADKQKLAKKMEKKFPTHIIVKLKDDAAYREFSYGKPVIPLNRISLTTLQIDIDIIKSKLKKGEVIVNTNLAAMGIQL